MIKSFGDKETGRLYQTGESVKYRAVLKAAIRKLDYLNAAKTLNDLAVLPGNRLEALKGDYQGRHSIRINDQFRIVFRFDDNDAYEVKIEDYH